MTTQGPYHGEPRPIPKSLTEPRAIDIVVEVEVKFDYRMSETWRQQTQEAIARALLPLDEDEAYRIALRWSTDY